MRNLAICGAIWNICCFCKSLWGILAWFSRWWNWQELCFSLLFGRRWSGIYYVKLLGFSISFLFFFVPRKEEICNSNWMEMVVLWKYTYNEFQLLPSRKYSFCFELIISSPCLCSFWPVRGTDKSTLLPNFHNATLTSQLLIGLLIQKEWQLETKQLHSFYLLVSFSKWPEKTTKKLVEEKGFISFF